jgi:uncharacterized protein (DUF885 family)
MRGRVRAAIEYLHAQSPIDDAAAGDRDRPRARRPAHALAAEVGAMRIRELRTRAEERLGSRFDLRAFHAAILEPGSFAARFAGTAGRPLDRYRECRNRQ